MSGESRALQILNDRSHFRIFQKPLNTLSYVSSLTTITRNIWKTREFCNKFACFGVAIVGTNFDLKINGSKRTIHPLIKKDPNSLDYIA